MSSILVRLKRKKNDRTVGAIIKLFRSLMKKTGDTLDYVKSSPYPRTAGRFLCSAAASKRARHVICMIRCISDWLMNRSEDSRASSARRAYIFFSESTRATGAARRTYSNLIVRGVAPFGSTTPEALCPCTRDTDAPVG